MSRQNVVDDPIDESALIERSHLLDAIADDDDIEWKTDPFEMRPESANPETPDEIIAMITFEGSPELQEQLRSLCREYIDIFSTSVRFLPAQVDPIDGMRGRFGFGFLNYRGAPRAGFSARF